MMRFVWLGCGLFSLSLGVLGAFVPLLPTVPLLLLAAFFFAKSSDRLHDWLISHPKFGPAISDWRERGAISRRAKWAASLSILASLGITLALGVPLTIIAIQVTTLAAVSLFIWSRPEI